MQHGMREILLGEISPTLLELLSQRMLHRQVCQCVSDLLVSVQSPGLRAAQSNAADATALRLLCPPDGKCGLKT